MSHIFSLRGETWRHVITDTPGTCEGCDYSDIPCKIGEAPCLPDTVLKLTPDELLKVEA